MGYSETLSLNVTHISKKLSYLKNIKLTQKMFLKVIRKINHFLSNIWLSVILNIDRFVGQIQI